MPSVVQVSGARPSNRNRRRSELHAAELRKTFPPARNPKPRFPYQALAGDLDSSAGRARGKFLDNLLRAKLGLDLYEVTGKLAVVEAPDGFKDHRGGPCWNAKLVTKRKYEPKHTGPRQ
jgi:hypothetical protein